MISISTRIIILQPFSLPVSKLFFKMSFVFLSNLCCNFGQHYFHFTSAFLQSVFYNFHHRCLYILVSILTFICKYHSTNLDIVNVTFVVKLCAL